MPILSIDGDDQSAAPASDFDRVARFYDLTYADFDDDLPMYRGFAERCGSPILEIGCGTGRVVLPLARAGFRVTGVDISPAMLSIARQKVEQAKVAESVSLQQADARHLHLKVRFALAMIASNSFGLFVSHEDQLQVLHSARLALRPNGLLIIDMFNPDLGLLSSEDGQLFHDFTRVDESTGHTILKMHSRQVDLGRQTIDVTFIYDEMAPDGTLRRTLFPFATRYFFLNELQLLLEKCGFELENVYGSHDLEPYHSESDRIITVASPAGRRQTRTQGKK
ncbi:MAG: methyltransferase domain-containing protein [Chloroflexi bacterium]|nr:methyltransferase domain-containing protein [Chloroflexota bacterium]MCL5025816.1 methyltransferase domain-containing protein [Chloroflexota bacterium]